jgi:hypothetical protein
MTATSPHTLEDILAVARRPGAAAPREIHVRARIHERMVEEAAAGGATVSVDEGRGIGSLDGIPVVVDEELPAFPGFEVHRVCVPPARSAA